MSDARSEPRNASVPLTPAVLLALLDRLGIAYRHHEHPPVYTCEQADEVVIGLDGARTKNLFLRDRKGRRHLLLVIRPHLVVDLRALGDELGLRGLSFASPDRLARLLGVEPGAVSLLALANDTERAVELVIDDALWRCDAFQCHPLVNTATLIVSRGDLERLYAHTGHVPRTMRLPQRVAGE